MMDYKPDQPVLNQPMQGLPPQQTVIQVNQMITSPMMPRGPPRPWSSELMACCDDMQVCLCACFIPCYSCTLATELNESCMFPMCAPGSFIAMRSLVRGRHNIEGNLCNDCIMFSCCGPCAECQLAREIKNIKAGKAAA